MQLYIIININNNILLMQSHSQYVLGYWAIRGLAQRIRLVLEYVGAKYTEVKYTDGAKWFESDKPAAYEHNALINLPYLKDGDKYVGESDAILLYIALKNKPQLVGRTTEEKVDMLALRSAFGDFHRNYIGLVYGNDFENRKPKFVEEAKKHLTKFSKFLGNKEYYAGGITLIDFICAEFFQVLTVLEPGLVEGFSNIHEHIKRIWSLPQIKAYKESSRFSESPYNGPTAAWGSK